MRRTSTIVLTLLVVTGLLTACGEAPSPAAGTSWEDDGNSPAAAGARRLEVAARSFAFDPKEITVKAGEDIAMVLKSQDSLHDVVLDDFETRVAAPMGKSVVGGFRASKPGRYTFYCSVTGHRRAGMEGVLVVED